MYPREILEYVHEETYSKMSSALLFMVAQN